MSNLSAFPYIPERAEAVPALWNNIFSILSANDAALNSAATISFPSGNTLSVFSSIDASGNLHAGNRIGVGVTPSADTVEVLTIGADSSKSDYILFHDPTGAKSSYVIGSRVGGTADGLNIYDASGSTMIASFSKQSIRFFQQVVGPVFDLGGALTGTYNAATFGTASQSTESRIQAAINQASIDHVERVYVPASMYPYSASSVSFIYTVQMTREGGDPSAIDVLAYGANGTGLNNDAPAVQSAINALPLGGTVVFPPGTYRMDSTLTVTAIGITFQGAGFASALRINHVNHGIEVTGQLFRINNFEIEISTAVARSTAIIHGQASQGYVSDLRIAGSPVSSNNGYVFLLDVDAADLWEFDHVRVTSATYISVFRLTCATGTSLAATIISHFTFVNGIVTVAVIDLDGAIDTVQISDSDFPTFGGKAIWARNAVAASFVPRWIHCSNCFVEGGGGGGAWDTAIQLDAVRDFRYTGGYVASASLGIVIGALARDVGIVNTEFVNIQQNAITIANGATSTTIAYNTFEETGNLTNNTYDTISVAANASDWIIQGNRFRSGVANLPRYSIAIAAGTTNNYRILDNLALDTGTGILNNGASGANRYIVGNHGLANTLQGDNTSFHSLVIINGGISNGAGAAFTGVGFIAVGGQIAQWLVTPTEAVLVSGITASGGNVFQVTLTTARVVGVPLSPTTGQRITYVFIQDGTGGRAVTWNAVFKVAWSDAGNTAGKRSTISCIYDGTNWNQDGQQSPYI